MKTNADLLKRKNLIDVKCSQCGEELQRRPDMIREHSFCNMVCANAFKRGGLLITDELKKEVKELRSLGWKYWQLSEYFGVNNTTIWRLIHD